MIKLEDYVTPYIKMYSVLLTAGKSKITDKQVWEMAPILKSFAIYLEEIIKIRENIIVDTPTSIQLNLTNHKKLGDT